MRMNVILFSKSKRTTQARKHLLLALKRHGLIKSVKWINHSKIERYLGKKLADYYVRSCIDRLKPELTILNKTDARLEWVEECKKHGVVASIYQDYNTPIKDQVVRFGKDIDLFYLSNSDQLEEYRSKGVAGAKFLCRGCSSDDHYPVAPRGGKYASDVAFIGKPGRPIRDKILNKVERNFDLKVWGPSWDEEKFTRVGSRVRAKKYRIICSSAKIILGINDASITAFENFYEQKHYMSNRDRLTLGCGGFLLTNYNPGLDDLFSPGQELAAYESLDDLHRKIEYYLQNPDKRKKIAYQGCTKIHSKHTFDHFIDSVVNDTRRILQEYL